VSAANLTKWEKAGVGSMDPKNKLFKSKKKAKLSGPLSQLAVINKALLCYIFEQREQGFVIDMLKITLHVSFLFPGFCESLMMGSVVQRIQELRVEVQHIAGGCTSLCQPINIGFNKPFTDHVRWAWHNWVMAEAVIHGTRRSPTRLNIATWVANTIE
jgi:hypothetical protein